MSTYIEYVICIVIGIITLPRSENQNLQILFIKKWPAAITWYFYGKYHFGRLFKLSRYISRRDFGFRKLSQVANLKEYKPASMKFDLSYWSGQTNLYQLERFSFSPFV